MERDPGSRDAPAQEVIPPGFLATLPAAAARRLLADAVRIDVPAGGTVYRDEESGRAIVVLHGLLRLYMRAPDGRQVTIRYTRPGEIVGLALVIGGPAPVSIQALTSASVVALRIDVLRALLETDPAVARACAEELARQLFRAFDEIAEQAFLSVRQRVARQLLDLAVHADDGTLLARVSQQELADAIASAREVVARALHELRQVGLVRLARTASSSATRSGSATRPAALRPKRRCLAVHDRGPAWPLPARGHRSSAHSVRLTARRVGQREALLFGPQGPRWNVAVHHDPGSFTCVEAGPCIPASDERGVDLHGCAARCPRR